MYYYYILLLLLLLQLLLLAVPYLRNLSTIKYGSESRVQILKSQLDCDFTQERHQNAEFSEFPEFLTGARERLLYTWHFFLVRSFVRLLLFQLPTLYAYMTFFFFWLQALAVGFAEKTGLNNKDIFSVVKAPKNMQYVANTLEKMVCMCVYYTRGAYEVCVYIHVCIHT